MCADCIYYVSIPLRGLGLFRPITEMVLSGDMENGFNPLAGIRAFQTLSAPRQADCLNKVSIPLRGLGLFRQFLDETTPLYIEEVSIPLRGLGLFRPSLSIIFVCMV